jgi:6-phosphofructokinase 1
MVALRSLDIVPVPIADVLREAKRVDLDGDVVKTARAVGVSFGD